MNSNGLKITFRTLIKHKIFAFVNIFGFAISISICLMIIIFIKDQKSSDRFHEKRDRIVRVYTTDKDIEFTSVRGYATTPGYLAPRLSDNYPYVEDILRLRRNSGNVVHNGENIFIGGFFAEPSFFNVFSFQLKEGDVQTALNEPYSVVISEAIAFKFFGNDDPMNKTIIFEKLGEYTVTGVLKDTENRSHFIFDVLFSFSTIPSLEKSGFLDSDMNSWSSFDKYYTYVLLENNEDESLFDEQLPDIAKVIIPEPENERFGFELQPLLDINLGINLWLSTPGTKKSFDIIYIPLLAIMIILLACFNYIILSIAHSLKRAKEIGFRKVIGSSRGQLIRLFLMETFVITFIALIAAGLLILWLTPAFNGLDFIQKSNLQVNMQQMKDPGLYVIFILFSMGISVLAGLFPALYLSSLQPINALQGASKIKGLTHLLARKILIGIQFAVSLVFIIFTIYYIRLNTSWMTFDYGIKTEDLVNVHLRDVSYQIFRDEMSANSNITDVSFSNEVPVFGSQSAINIGNKTMEKPRSTFYYSIDPGFLHNFSLELVAGRNFSDEFSTDIKRSIIINQEAIKVFDLGSPLEAIGKILFVEDDQEAEVIGVVKNFVYYAPDEPIYPLVLQYRPEEFKYVNISYVPGRKSEIKTFLQDTWKKYDTNHSLSFQFFDDAQKEVAQEFKGIIRILGFTCGFIILIALFGLLGMASYTTELRVKEIGIRKVFGSSIVSAVYLLSKDYIKLISYSAAFAIPIAYFLSNMFYDFFAFSPDLSLWVLPMALIMILVLALTTICSQTIKTALSNPAITLKEE